MRAVMLGATRGMGRALARRMVERGDRVFLLGNDADDLERSAADLEARGRNRSKVEFTYCDLESPEGFEPALAAADAGLIGFDTVILSAAIFAGAEQVDGDSALAERLLTVDFTHTVLFCEIARKWLLERGGGTLCVFSSVAGDRARKPTSLYGAAKAGLTHYLENLDLRFRDQGLVTLCVKPGFVKTGMTEGLKPPPFAGEPDGVAKDVLKAIDRQRAVLYTPLAWRAVMLVIRNLPKFVMRRLNF
ncbi:MAG: SDR family NAD(P)-dependent oxidoreductase [Planctomycetota bacterium]